MEKKESKKELIGKSQELADKFNEKKEVISIALDTLDEKAKEKGITEEHVEGMALIEEMFNELDSIKLEQEKINMKIKNI
jgi:hypothetical protein